MLSSVWSYVRDVLEESVRLALATGLAAVLNFLLFQVGLSAWDMYQSTHMGAEFASRHPEAHRLLGEVIALTPYWHTSLQLAAASMLGALAVAVPAQVLGIRRLLFDPLSLLFRISWAVALAMLLAVPVGSYDTRLGAWHSYVILLLPGMVCALFPAMRAARCLLPDVTALLFARR